MRFTSLMAGITIVSAGMVAHATPITYNTSQSAGGATAVGTITTDGAIGVLTTADITNIMLTVSHGVTSGALDSSTGVEFVVGSDLTATTSGLFFNFGDSVSGGLLILGPNYNSLCYDSQGTFCGAASASLLLAVDGTRYESPFSGVQQIATAATTPEPSSIALLGTGLLGIAGTLRQRSI